MKRTLRTATLSILSGLLLGAIILIGGCADNQPTTPEETASNQETLNFVKWGDGSLSLNKIISDSKWVTRRNGGTLSLQYQLAGNRNVRVVVTLNIPPQSISRDAEVSMSLDDQYLVGNIDLTFSPHGVTFSKAAMLNIEAYGLDLSEIDPEKIDVYYFNQESGRWERMQSRQVIVDTSRGFVNIVLAELPHFSRYAVAWGE